MNRYSKEVICKICREIATNKSHNCNYFCFPRLHKNESINDLRFPMKTKSTSIIFLTFISFNLILASCSNPKEASEANFKQALNTILTKHRVGCVPVLGNMESFPITISKLATEQINQLNSLVKVGFLSSKEGEKKIIQEKVFRELNILLQPREKSFTHLMFIPDLHNHNPQEVFVLGKQKLTKFLTSLNRRVILDLPKCLM